MKKWNKNHEMLRVATTVTCPACVSKSCLWLSLSLLPLPNDPRSPAGSDRRWSSLLPVPISLCPARFNCQLYTALLQDLSQSAVISACNTTLRDWQASSNSCNAYCSLHGRIHRRYGGRVPQISDKGDINANVPSLSPKYHTSLLHYQYQVIVFK